MYNETLVHTEEKKKQSPGDVDTMKEGLIDQPDQVIIDCCIVVTDKLAGDWRQTRVPGN